MYALGMHCTMTQTSITRRNTKMISYEVLRCRWIQTYFRDEVSVLLPFWKFFLFWQHEPKIRLTHPELDFIINGKLIQCWSKSETIALRLIEVDFYFKTPDALTRFACFFNTKMNHYAMEKCTLRNCQSFRDGLVGISANLNKNWRNENCRKKIIYIADHSFV